MTPGFGLVALPLPLAQPYSYRIPETHADRVVPGARVVVLEENYRSTQTVRKRAIY